ncbi:MAG: ABC transporter permease [Deltaproteobacteria bacterium]|nr:ABC transporter permease [Deltaproteobacteria bacterium]
MEDLLVMCWRSVLRNRRRYKAVMIGIALGTAGFIVVQTMGDSVEKKMGEHLELLGEATVMKAVWRNEENYHPGEYQMSDVKRLRRIPHTMAVAPVVSIPAIDAFFETNEWSPGLIGVDQEFWLTQSSQLREGRFIGATDVVGRKNVCVLGQNVAKNLFGREKLVGELVGVGSLKFEVVGLLGGVQQNDLERYIIIPLTTAQRLFSGLEKIREIYIRVDNWNEVEPVRDKALKILRETHKGYEQGIEITYYPRRIEKVKSTVYMVKLFVYAALGVTILLGGIGIMAVMLTAVQDRTREIGLRKALGAKEDLILLQFLLEAVLISLMAGCIGVMIGVFSVTILKGPLGVEVSKVMLIVSIMSGIVFTAFLGIASGLYPSMKASRMDSVTAMRFE